MKKFILLLLFLLLIPLTFTACAGELLFAGLDYQRGVMLFLDGDENNFYAEFHIVVPGAGAHVNGQHREYFYDILNEEFPGQISTESFSGDSFEELVNANGNKSGDVLYIFYFKRAKTGLEREAGYRFDPAFTVQESYYNDENLFTGKVKVEYSNPFQQIKTYGVIQRIYERFNTDHNSPLRDEEDLALKTLIPVARSYKIFGGTRVPHEFQYYAQYSTTAKTVTAHDTIGFSASYLISWSWFLMAALAAVIIVVLILLLAKKGNGKIMNINRVVINRFGKITTIHAPGAPQSSAVFPELGEGDSNNNNNNNDIFPGF